MVEPVPYSRLDNAARKRILERALVRPTATALMLTALYFLVPMSEIADLGSIAFFCSMIVLVIAVCAWQVTKVLRAEYPAVQAIEALAAVIPVYLFGFSTAYFLIASSSAANFSEAVSRMGSLYFTLSVFTTVGFGDITASTDFARAVVTVQMVGNLVIVALGGRLLLAAVRRGRARRADG